MNYEQSYNLNLINFFKKKVIFLILLLLIGGPKIKGFLDNSFLTLKSDPKIRKINLIHLVISSIL